MNGNQRNHITTADVLQAPRIGSVSDLLDQTQQLEDLHSSALRFHWRRLFELRARRRQLETLAFGGRR